MKRVVMVWCCVLAALGDAQAATKYWVGRAATVGQRDTLTPANVEIGDTFTVTCNGKNLTVTATAATVANVTALLDAAIDSSSEPEFQELNASDQTTYVQIVHDASGTPFTLTSSAANVMGGANDQTLTQATATAASGPNHWSAAANWSTGAAPANSDDVHIQSGPDIKYGLAQSGVTLTSLTIYKSYEREIGLAQRRANGYQEYRDTYLAIGATTVHVGYGGGTGDGSRLIRLNTGSAETAVRVWYTQATSNEDDPALESFAWKGSHSGNEIYVFEGSVGVASAPGETATVAYMTVSRSRVTEDTPAVRIGSGVTLDTLNIAGGVTELYADPTHLWLMGGLCKFRAASFTGTLHIDFGPLHLTRP